MPYLVASANPPTNKSISPSLSISAALTQDLFLGNAGIFILALLK